MKHTIAWVCAPLCLAVALGSATPSGARSPSARARSVPGGRSDLALGRQLFVKNCALCHGADAKGKSGPRLVGNSLSLDTIEKKVMNGGTRMPSLGSKLSPAEVEAVAAYVRSLGARR